MTSYYHRFLLYRLFRYSPPTVRSTFIVDFDCLYACNSHVTRLATTAPRIALLSSLLILILLQFSLDSR